MNNYLIVTIGGNVQVATAGVILSSTFEQYSKDHPRVISANTLKEAVLKYKDLEKPKKEKIPSKKEKELQDLRHAMKVLDALATIYSN